MFRNILVSAYLLCVNGQGLAFFDPADVPWLATLQTAKIFFFHVCGSAEIMPTKKSLKNDFVIGSEGAGYFFTGTPGISEYRSYITEDTTQDAKTRLQARFKESRLWKYSQQRLTDLGVPTRINLPFEVTIMDCMSGSKNSLGRKCPKDSNQKICCSEKFAGPMIYWGSNQEYVLKYSPDPSVKLKVKGEFKNRFCNFQQIIEVKGSGR